MAKNVVLLASKVTYHFVQQVIGFVVCCDTVKHQKHCRQRQQGHHGDFMWNEGHFLLLREKFTKIRQIEIEQKVIILDSNMEWQANRIST